MRPNSEPTTHPRKDLLGGDQFTAPGLFQADRDVRPKPLQLEFTELVMLLKREQRGADDFPRIGVLAILHLLAEELVKIRRKRDRDVTCFGHNLVILTRRAFIG
jgi:hypothetical protein